MICALFFVEMSTTCIKERMFTLAKEAAENSARYYSVVMKVKKTDNTTDVEKDNDRNDNDTRDKVVVKKQKSKKASKDKVSKKASKDKVKNKVPKQASMDEIPWVQIKLEGRKPTKVYRRTDCNRNSLQGKTFTNVVTQVVFLFDFIVYI